MRRVIRWMLLLQAVALTSGCATKALWTEADLDTWNEPASNSHLGLFEDQRQKDLLVVYDEYHERNEAVRKRAYLLNGNQKRIEARRQPHFVSTKRIKNLPPVPIFQTSAARGTNSPQLLYAIAAPDGKSFKVFSDGRKLCSYELPVYNDGAGRIKRVALTPLSVTADLTIVGGFLGAWVWAGGGFSSVH